MTETHERLVGRLAAVLAGVQGMEPVPQRLCEAGRQMLGADGVAITLSTAKGSRETVGATDALSTHLEDLQDVVGQGPSVDALSTRMVEIASLRADDDQRWPLMQQHGAGLDFAGTMIAVLLVAGDDVIGVLTAHRQGGATDDDRDIGLVLGPALGTALLHDPQLGLDGHGYADEWPSRAQIHQATGMVVGQVGVLPEDALALLKGQAFAQGSTLTEVARQVVERRIDLRRFTIETD